MRKEFVILAEKHGHVHGFQSWDIGGIPSPLMLHGIELWVLNTKKIIVKIYGMEYLRRV